MDAVLGTCAHNKPLLPGGTSTKRHSEASTCTECCFYFEADPSGKWISPCVYSSGV
jgi:hypothetical protein